MCYFSSISVGFKIIEDRFDVRFVQREAFKPAFSVCGFEFPALPVITGEPRRQVLMMNWGLIPFWVKNLAGAKEIREKTLNARAESLFEKPSFKYSIQIRRCLVPVDGFYEWQHRNKKAYPYFIHLKSGEPFAMAGIWDNWSNPENGETIKTFAVITTPANPLLEIIHNTQKRMPAILTRENEGRWLQRGLDKEAITAMLHPYEEDEMEAYPVSGAVRQSGYNISHPEVREKVME
jgi:putative SOS response-associated peptidase YedK